MREMKRHRERWRFYDDWWCRPADLWDELEEAGYFAESV